MVDMTIAVSPPVWALHGGNPAGVFASICTLYTRFLGEAAAEGPGPWSPHPPLPTRAIPHTEQIPTNAPSFMTHSFGSLLYGKLGAHTVERDQRSIVICSGHRAKHAAIECPNERTTLGGGRAAPNSWPLRNSRSGPLA